MKAPVSRAGAPAGTWVHCLHWQLLRVVTLACSLTLYAPAQGPTERPWSEASIWGRLHFLWSKMQGGWVMGEKAQIPPGPPLPITLIDYSTWMKTATKCWLAILETHRGSSWHCEFPSQSSPTCVTLATCVRAWGRNRGGGS